MADFDVSITKILKFEGGYVNDPQDNGGETFKGISRKNWPSWEGWKAIDLARTLPGFPKNLTKSRDLFNQVQQFYKTNFWDKVGGDNLKSQAIADLLVDSAVNEGVKPAVKRAEVIVGLPPTGNFSALLISKLNAL